MNLDLEQIKEFILWCKENNVYKGSVGPVQFEFTALSMYTDPSILTQDPASELLKRLETLSETETKEQDIKNDPDLFYSA